MSSPYPILDNRPIDKWKVTELKEELKRRKLTTRGLKDELVKRLDESLRIERENAEADEGVAEEGGQDKNTTPVIEKATPVIDVKTPVGGKATPVTGEATPVGAKATFVIGEDALFGEKATPVAAQEKGFPTETPVEAKEALSAAEEAPASVTKPAMVEKTPAAVETNLLRVKGEYNSVKHTDDKKVDDFRNRASADNSMVDMKQEKDQEGYVRDETSKSECGVTSTDSLVAEEVPSELVIPKSDVEIENKEPESRLVSEDSKHQPENGGINQPENEGMKAQTVDGSASNNQVSEVSLVSGFEVKSDCISTDSVSNNENKLKDNIIADNVKLEYNVIKSEEMVEPSSVGGKSHPMDVEEPFEQRMSVGDRDDSSAANADMTKANDNIDAGDSEKLNLDRSSGDDSMDEEVDTKQTESNNSDEVNRSEKSEVPAEKVETAVDIVGKDVVAGKGDLPGSKNQPVTTSEKRKLPVNDQEGVGNNEPVKKQRRWNSENIKVPEAQTSNSTLTATPKSMGLHRNFSRSDSSASEDVPKERFVPPSQKDPTNSLRIDHFLRPFTLKAVEELLGKTGTVTSFWMDHIKTHCYVSYSSVEEAVETRNAVYNLQWPPNGGRLLIAEFVDPEEVKAKVEAPLAPATPAVAPSQPTSQPHPYSRPLGSRGPQQPQQPPPPTALPPPPAPVSNPPPVKERLPSPPPVPEPPPILTLDDLFRKTKATPRIYYLPLSEEQVTAKCTARGKSTAK